MLNKILALLILMAIANNVQAQETDYELIGSYNASGYVFSVSVSSDGSMISANSVDNIYFFSGEGKPYRIVSKLGLLKKTVVSSDGSHVAAISGDKIFFFNHDGKLLWEHEGIKSMIGGYTGRIDPTPFNSVWINSDGSYIGAETEQRFYLFDSKRKNIIFSKGENIVSYAVSPDKSLIAEGDGNNIYLFSEWGITLYNYQTDSDVRIVLMSSDGSNLSAITGKSIYFLNHADWRYNLKNDLSNINTASMSTDGSYVTAGSGNTVYLFRNGKLLWDYDTNHSISEVKISSDGSHIAAGAGSNIYVFDREGTLLWNYKTGNSVLSVSISSNGSYVAAGSKDNKAYFIRKKNSIVSIPPSPTNQTSAETNVSTFMPLQTPEPVQNITPRTKSTPFISAIYAIAVLFAVWRSLRRRYNS